MVLSRYFLKYYEILGKSLNFVVRKLPLICDIFYLRPILNNDHLMNKSETSTKEKPISTSIDCFVIVEPIINIITIHA